MRQVDIIGVLASYATGMTIFAAFMLRHIWRISKSEDGR